MFWERKETRIVRSDHIFVVPPPPPKKHFVTMLEVLKDAEKYDNSGDIDVSKKLLKTLCEYAEVYCNDVTSKDK